ncbi:MAG: PASTA domain-containing protein [Bacteroidales bacterium]|nr:PASTA domain-containing protein [Bacteroidales bacterium]
MEEKNNTSKFWILKNLAGALLFFVALAVVANVLLGIFTHHGKVIQVPDMVGLSVREADHVADTAGVRIDVVDSIYVRGMAKGAVYKQNPAAGSNVKKGRRIMLTINATQPKRITMPNLVGYSMRQAKAELSSRGLNLGRLVYVDDIATNNVLKQQQNGRDVRPGSSVESGSDIDLVVGLNGSDNRTYIPNVMGMKYIRAVDVVHENSLNVGNLVFDASVRNYNDTINSVVYRQSPGASQAPTQMGSSVSLYLTVDPERIPK